MASRLGSAAAAAAAAALRHISGRVDAQHVRGAPDRRQVPCSMCQWRGRLLLGDLRLLHGMPDLAAAAAKCQGVW